MPKANYSSDSLFEFQNQLLVQSPLLGISSQELHLLLALANNYGIRLMESGSLYIDVEYLRQEYFQDRDLRTIQRYLRSLREKGLLLAEEQKKGFKRIVRYSFVPLFRKLAEHNNNDKNVAADKCTHTTVEYSQDKEKNPHVSHDKNVAFNYLINKLKKRIPSPLVDNLSEQQLARWRNKYKLPSEIIIELVTFCSTLGRTDPPYLESVAKDWATERVWTLEEARTMMEWFREEKEIRIAMGVYAFNRQERKIYRQWRRLGFTNEVILFGIEQARGARNKFKYVEALLKDWDQEGIYDLDAAAECVKVGKKTPEKRNGSRQKKDKPSTQPKQPTAVKKWNGMEIDAYTRFMPGVPKEVAELSRQLAAQQEKKRQLDAVANGGWC